MKIIITGASTYGVKNLGDDAMLKVLCDEIKKKIPPLQKQARKQVHEIIKSFDKNS